VTNRHSDRTIPMCSNRPLSLAIAVIWPNNMRYDIRAFLFLITYVTLKLGLKQHQIGCLVLLTSSDASSACNLYYIIALSWVVGGVTPQPHHWSIHGAIIRT